MRSSKHPPYGEGEETEERRGWCSCFFYLRVLAQLIVSKLSVATNIAWKPTEGSTWLLKYFANGNLYQFSFSKQLHDKQMSFICFVYKPTNFKVPTLPGWLVKLNMHRNQTQQWVTTDFLHFKLFWMMCGEWSLSVKGPQALWVIQEFFVVV